MPPPPKKISGCVGEGGLLPLPNNLGVIYNVGCRESTFNVFKSNKNVGNQTLLHVIFIKKLYLDLKLAFDKQFSYEMLSILVAASDNLIILMNALASSC